MSSNPTFKALSDYLESPVLIKLKGGKSIKGVLVSYDMHLNIILSDAEEIDQNGNSRPLGKILIRGDNVIIISPAK